jgi:hypothetical protein
MGLSPEQGVRFKLARCLNIAKFPAFFLADLINESAL